MTTCPIFEVFPPEDFTDDPDILELLPSNAKYTTVSDSKSEMEEFGYGVQAGIGYQSNSLLLRFGFEYGLNKIRNDDVRIKIDNPQAFRITIGYIINDIFESSGERPKYDLELIE